MDASARLAGGFMASGIFASRTAGFQLGNDLRRGVRNGVCNEATFQSAAGQPEGEVARTKSGNHHILGQRIHDFGLAQRPASPHVAHTA